MLGRAVHGESPALTYAAHLQLVMDIIKSLEPISWVGPVLVACLVVQVLTYFAGRALIPIVGCKGATGRSSPSKVFQRQHGWVLSTVAAALLFAVGVTHWAKLLRVAADIGMDREAWAEFLLSRPAHVELAIVYFFGHCITDTVLGTVFYPDAIDILSGYAHHALYLYVCYYTITECPAIFGMFFVAELPTLLMGLGSIDARMRNDCVFGWAFGVSRLVMHISAIVLFTWACPHLVMAQILGHVTLSMHIYWFYGFCTKYGCMRPAAKVKTA